MDTVIDMRDLTWKDNDTADFVRIVDFSQSDDMHLVWYMDVESLDEHCMDVDAFVEKHTACGLFDDLEHA